MFQKYNLNFNLKLIKMSESTTTTLAVDPDDCNEYICSNDKDEKMIRKLFS